MKFLDENGLLYYTQKIKAWLNGKVDKVEGKALSTNDYTTTEKTKLAGIAVGAEVNVQADWNATSGAAMILNKPNIPEGSTLYDTTGQNTDGAMTQKATTDALSSKAEASAIPTILVTQHITSGEKIATITINGTETNIFATKPTVEYTAYGAATPVAVSANSYKTISVSFPTGRFNASPRVVGTLYATTSITAHQCTLHVSGISKTGCTFTIRNNGTADRSFGVQWFAISSVS